MSYSAPQLIRFGSAIRVTLGGGPQSGDAINNLES